MGTPGTPGGFDLQHFFKTAPPSTLTSFAGGPAGPYPAVNHPYQQQVNHQFPLNSFAPSSSFPSLPGPFPYNTQQPPQPGMQTPGMYSPYMPYPQEHGSRPPAYPPGAYGNAPSFAQGPPHGTFAQPQFQSGPSPPPMFTQSQSSSAAPPSSGSQQQSVPQTSAPASSGAPQQTQAPDPVSSPPLDGAHLMALLTTQSAVETTSKEESTSLLMGTTSLLDLPQRTVSPDSAQGASAEVSLPPPAISPALPTAPPVNLAPPTSRFPGSKPPAQGRFLQGEHVVYDVDVRLPSEAKPQLEVSPITVYSSEPVLVLGRQIAVNKSYICYGLRLGTIRILNIHTALRALLRGHSQRVTDMEFFSDDVHLLASASTDGRVFVRRIVEGLSDDGKPIIKDNILFAMQLVGDWDSVHPRVCWHSQNQEVLILGVGRYVLSIDTNQARVNAPPGGFTGEEDAPRVYDVNNLPEGVHVVGEHNSDITDLSFPQFNPTYFVSASQDGKIKIWGDRKTPLAVITPHQGQAVNSVSFISPPQRPEYTVLVTAGPFNHELKIWELVTPEGPPGRAGGGKWQCVQTLELKSSASEGRLEKAFFNQVLVVRNANLLVLANAQKNALYVVHLDFGASSPGTRMDYLAEFSVTKPILSLTATSEGVSDGDGTVQVYCVQTHAIQQYALDLSLCLPDPEDVALEKSILESQNTTRVSNQAFISADSGYASAANELTSVSTVASIVTVSPSNNTMGPTPGPFGPSVERPGTSEQQAMNSSEGMVVIESTVTHQATEVDVLERIDSLSSLSSLNRYNDSPSAQHAVRPVSPAQVPSFLKRPPQSESPTKGSEDRFGLALKDLGGSAEQLENNSVHEQPPLESVLAEVGGLSSVPSISQGEDNVFEKGEETMSVAPSSTSKAPATSQQQSSAGPVHLLSPSELMSMVARSKASEADITVSASLPAVESELSTLEPTSEGVFPEVDILQSEIDVTTELDVTHSETIGEKDGGLDEKASVLLDVKDKALVNTSLEFSNKDFNWDGGSSGTNFVEASPADEVRPVEDGEGLDERELLPNSPAEDLLEHVKEVGPKVGETTSISTTPAQSSAVTRGRKNKNKTNVLGGVPTAVASTSIPAPTPTPTPVLSSTVPTTSEGEGSTSATAPLPDVGSGHQIVAMQESLNQLVTMQKELQKQMTVMVAVPVTKEGKRLEGALGKQTEKLLKANMEAMWARIQEESAKKEKADKERLQQLTSSFNTVAKDIPATLERAFKKEIAAIGPTVSRLVSPIVERTIMSVIADTFQKGAIEKVVPQLEKVVALKLESAVTQQLQAQLQQSLRPALQESLRTSFEMTVIPGFERSCQAMFQQVDATFQRGLAEHTANAQQQFEASHSTLASTLQDTMLSATSLAASLKGELTEGQRKLISLAENAGARAPLTVKQSNGGLPDKVLSLQHLEESLDPTIELARLVSERKLEEAFNKALSLSDVAIVSWLCTQVDMKVVFGSNPLPLSQGVLLSLVQQLGCDLGKDTAHKLEWIREGALALNPEDPVLAPHMRPFLEQLYQNLHRHMQLTSAGGEPPTSMRLVIHVVNSLLTACK